MCLQHSVAYDVQSRHTVNQTLFNNDYIAVCGLRRHGEQAILTGAVETEGVLCRVRRAIPQHRDAQHQPVQFGLWFSKWDARPREPSGEPCPRQSVLQAGVSALRYLVLSEVTVDDGKG